jgi:hypothetical protein
MSGALRRLERGENSPPAPPIASVTSTEKCNQLGTARQPRDLMHPGAVGVTRYFLLLAILAANPACAPSVRSFASFTFCSV